MRRHSRTPQVGGGLDRTRAPTAPSRRRRPSATRRWKTPTPPKRSSRSTTLTSRRTRVAAPRTARRTTTRRVTRRISPSETGAPTRTRKTSPWASPRTSGRTRTRTRPRLGRRPNRRGRRRSHRRLGRRPAAGELGPVVPGPGSFSRELVRAPVRPRVFSSFPDPKARARDAFARADLASRASSRVSTAHPARHRHARTPRARPAQRPPLRFLRNPSLYRASCPIPRASSGFDFRLSFWRGFFPLEPDAETNPPHPRRRRAVSRRG